MRHGSLDEGVEVARWLGDARLGDLPRIRDVVTEGWSRAGAVGDVGFRLGLAAHEVVTNVLRHGYPTGSGWLALELRQVDECVQLSIRDRAAAFDPTTIATTPVGGTPAGLAEGGRGLRLVRHLVDRVDYQRVAGSNRLLLTIDEVMRASALQVQRSIRPVSTRSGAWSRRSGEPSSA